MKNKKPNIRFNGFRNNWYLHNVSGLSETFSGGTPSSNKKEYYDGEIPFIRSGEINLEKTELFLTEKGLKNSSSKYVEKGDILYAMYGANSGDVAVGKINGAINQAILAIKPKEGYQNYFIYSWLLKEKNNIVNKYIQGGQGNLSGNIIKKLKLYVPKFEEQTQIGNFFKELDELIELQQATITNLEEVKKGFLSKVYPDYGKKETKISFGGNSSKWTINYLKNLSIKEIKGSIQAVDITNNSKDTTLYLDANRLNGGTSQYTLHNKDTFYNDIIMLWDGSKAGQVFTGFEGVLGSTLKRFVIKNEYDSDFIFYQLVKHENRILLNYRTPNIPHVVKDFSTIFKINDLKDLKTQKFIGGFFRELDKFIELEKTELKLFQEMKKGFLHKMFV